MATATDTNTLEVSSRTPEGSRATRRLRREGLVPGVIYGGDGEPETFAVNARILRNTLAHAGAVIELSVDGGAASPVLVKDIQRHPVRGEPMHVDLLRVNMNVAIQTTVTLELTGAEDAPGVKEGGVLSQEHREITISALPGDIPDILHYDVSHMQINETAHLSDLKAPDGVEFVDDPETVVASVTPPTLEPVDEDIETETGIVGEDAPDASSDEAEAQASGDTADEAAAGDDSSDAS